MKKTLLILVIGGCLFTAAIRSVLAAEVVQGKCLGMDRQAQTLLIEEYDINFTRDHPYGRGTGIVTSFDISRAVVGLTPEYGDILRIAYDLDGSGKFAIKVMNVSKQKARE